MVCHHLVKLKTWRITILKASLQFGFYTWMEKEIT